MNPTLQHLEALDRASHVLGQLGSAALALVIVGIGWLLWAEWQRRRDP